MSKTKSFDISKQAVWNSYLKVKSNQGAAGVDRQSIVMFEGDLKNNLYKIWNRMSSGSYFPPPVLRVEIPKGDGKMRALGIPTVADRIAQMVVKNHVEPELETIFHPDSYGYRPGRSARQALTQARKRCWKHDWVIDMDIKGFFDNIPHDLMMRAVRKHTQEKWVVLYVERWLKAPVQLMNGEIEERTLGTPQGGVISPLLANLFLHYAFDHWMRSKYPATPFERYADDVVVHCNTEAEAVKLKSEIAKRMEQCGLELHPDKTKIVYCKDANRTGNCAFYSFDFLGFTHYCDTSRKGTFKVGRTTSRKKFTTKCKEMNRWLGKIRNAVPTKDWWKILQAKMRGHYQYYGVSENYAGIRRYYNTTIRMVRKWMNRRSQKRKMNWRYLPH